jgi:hypothetical protein
MAERPRPDEEHFGEASLGAAQSSNPPDDPEMIAPDADPLDTDVEDADLFLGLDDEDKDEAPRW